MFRMQETRELMGRKPKKNLSLIHRPEYLKGGEILISIAKTSEGSRGSRLRGQVRNFIRVIISRNVSFSAAEVRRGARRAAQPSERNPENLSFSAKKSKLDYMRSQD